MNRLLPLLLALGALRPGPALAAPPDQAKGQAAAAKADPDGAAFLEADPESLPTPPGRREDQALWGHTLEAGFQLLSERNVSRQLLFKAVGGRFDEVLGERAQGAGEDAKKAASLRQRLSAAYGAVYGNVKHAWGVDWRLGCRSQALDLEGAMRSASTAETGELREARRAAQECADKAARGARAVHESNQALRATLAEAEPLLPRAAPAPAQPAPADPVPAAR